MCHLRCRFEARRMRRDSVYLVRQEGQVLELRKEERSISPKRSRKKKVTGEKKSKLTDGTPARSAAPVTVITRCETNLALSLLWGGGQRGHQTAAKRKVPQFTRALSGTWSHAHNTLEKPGSFWRQNRSFLLGFNIFDYSCDSNFVSSLFRRKTGENEEVH